MSIAIRDEIMPVRSKLSPVAEAVIKQEADRIAALGSDWQPTYETLSEVVEKVRAAEAEALRARQVKGIQKAREAGSPHGRKTIPIPDNFEEIYDRWLAGEIDRKEAAALLDVSPSTFDKWRKAPRIRKGESESAKDARQKAKAPSKPRSPQSPRPKKDMAPDERRMLSVIRNAKKNPDGLAWITVNELSDTLGWSRPKVTWVRDRLVESGRLIKEECHTKTSKRTQFGYRITRAGLRFLKKGPAQGSQEAPGAVEPSTKATSTRGGLAPLAIPDSFDDVYHRYITGELLFLEAADELGVSEPTLRKWIHLRYGKGNDF